jgi:hypothetical protein
MSNFKKEYLANNVDISSVDDFVDAWHKSPKGTLKEYLGLTDEEFSAFTQGEKHLEEILKKEKHKTASILKALSKCTSNK